MPIKLKANNGNIDLKAPIKQVGGKVDSVNGMTGDVVLDIPSKTSDLVNDSGFLTEHQSLAEYAKKSELFSKDYNDLTNKPTIPSIDGLASTSYVDSKVAEIDVPTKTSDLINDSGFLTEHQSLADYAKKSEIPDVSGFLTSIPDEYVTEAELDAKGYLTEHQSLAEYAKKSELFSKDYNDLTNKPTIPSVEGLASTQYVDEKVATKQDTLTAGNNITIENGVISATGGSGGGSYTLPVADYDTLGGVKAKQTESDKNYGVVYIDSEARLRVPIARQGVGKNAGIVLPVNGQFRVENNGDMFLRPADNNIIGGVKPDGTTTTVDTDGTIHAVMPEPYTLPTATTTTLGGVKPDGNMITITKDGTISVDKSKISASNGLPSGGWYPQILMKNSNNNYDSTWSNISDVLAMAGISIGGGGSDWQVTTSTSESNLYNAKEVVIFWQDSNYNRHQSYLNVGCDYYGNSGNTWGTSNWINTQIRLDSVDSSNNGSSITYDGSSINTSDCIIEAICYKT